MPVVTVVPRLGPRMISGSMKSFQIQTPRKIVTLAVAGRSSGKTIRPEDLRPGGLVDHHGLFQLGRQPPLVITLT
jgi:hypothetical protein